MNDPSRILIVRLSAIGDVIHGVPVLCALRAAIPDAFIGWVVEGRAGDLLEGHPALDELDPGAARLAQIAARNLAAAASTARVPIRYDDRSAVPHQECHRRLAERCAAADRQGGRRRPRAESLVSQRAGGGRRRSRDRTLPRHVAAAGDINSSRAFRFAGELCRRADGRRVPAHRGAGRAALRDVESGSRLAVEDLAG